MKRSLLNNTAAQRFFLILAILILFLGLGHGDNLFTLPQNILVEAEKQHGPRARKRLLAWQTLIRTNTNLSDEEKLIKVNNFFNQIPFIEDKIHWKTNDYWATPVEFLVTAGGDCEDFSLAKYFTCKALGIPEKKLNMTYVKALYPRQAHMVVTYYRTPGAIPLVLDNLVPEILPADRRKDLIPVYSFNGIGLWLAKSRGKGEKVGNSVQLERWQNLLNRMPDELK